MYSIYKWAQTYHITYKYKTKFVVKIVFLLFRMGQNNEEQVGAELGQTQSSLVHDLLPLIILTNALTQVLLNSS